MPSETQLAAEAPSPTHIGDAGPSVFYGPRIVAAAFLVQALGVGATIIPFGFFIEPIEREFGASRSQMLLGMSMFNVAMALCSPLVGRVADRGPLKAMMLAGAVTMGVGMALLSRGTSLLELVLLFGGVVALGVALFSLLPASTMLANWYVERRGTALGIAATGTTAAGMIVPALTAYLLTNHGWRATLLYLGVGGAAIALPVIALLVVRRPEDIGQLPDGKSAARERVDALAHGPAPASDSPLNARILLAQPSFWLLCGIFALCFGSTGTMITTVVPFARSLGNDLASASLLQTSVAAASLCGKLLFGALMDRMDRRAAVAISMAIQILGWLVFLSEPGFGFLMAGYLFWGLGMGGLMPMQCALLGATFGRASFGRVLGVMGPVMLPLTAAIPPLAGLVFDATGSYVAMYAPLLGGYTIAALLLFFLRIPEVEPGTETVIASEAGRPLSD